MILTHIKRSMFVICSSIALHSFALSEETEVTGTSVGDYGENGTDVFGSNPSKSGRIDNSVDLFTGQHIESIPLFSLNGRGQLSVDVVLSYNGNVASKSKSENRNGQASEFGLGFHIGGGSIIADHNNTASILDDQYALVVDAQPIILRSSDVNPDRFYLESGDPLVIYRFRGDVMGVDAVIGWRILQQDGTVFQYGELDNDHANWNATQNVLRYGFFVGAGVSQDDKPYPHRWDLKSISDAQELNSIQYTYEHESEFSS